MMRDVIYAAFLFLGAALPAFAFCGTELDLGGTWAASSEDRAVFVGDRHVTTYPPADPQPMTFDLDDAFTITATGPAGADVVQIDEWGPAPLDWNAWFARVPDVAMPDWEPAELAVLSGCEADEIPTYRVTASGTDPEMGARTILMEVGQIGEDLLVGFYEETGIVEGQAIRVVQFMTLTR